MKINETRHVIAFCLCALHMLSNTNLYYRKESNGWGGGIIQEYACKRGLKIDPKQKFTELLLSFYFDEYIFSLSFYIKTAKMIVDVRRRV